MSFHLQSKLLRVLQEGEFSPLGSEATVKSDVWVVAATNRNLKADIAEKKFRPDLFYRLSTIEINVEPLRNRREEIPLLVDHFWNLYAARFTGTPKPEIGPETRRELLQHAWPGNVRELQNVIQRILVTGDSREVIEEMIARSAVSAAGSNPGAEPAPPNLMAMLGIDDWRLSDGKPLPIKTIRKKAANLLEKAVISQVLRKTGWNRSKAAQILKISYKTLLLKIETLALEPPAEFN
jgi:DNA-binding NtrC family response regulator